jgi:1-acyl-sn-glycerol-3-phosphate acyltransferase
MFRHPFRTLRKLVVFFGICVFALADYFFRIWLPGLVNDNRIRGAWLHRWSRRLVKLLNIQITSVGTPPQRGLLVSNHLSYLDIVVFGAAQPMIFVSKDDVRSWPIIGWMTRCAGTLYINRQRKSDVAEIAPAFAPVINQGMVLTLFPEGTSTGGDRVLPFMSSLFEPAVLNDWPVSPAWIGYALENGSVADEVCYWRDMTFFSHFLNLLSKKSIQAKIVFDVPAPATVNRKQLARNLHAQVCAFARTYGTPPSTTLKPAAPVFAEPKAAF